ncbi:hypothetical protein GCM10010384_17740 [Streptomyces djakartensis]|uniref:Uncharacterized protein n=1 Tax=Streptomyces djakartensis TaxID=68193 RepID=A0ABQ2ZE97_9ACTN|nr:hypothetical protein GCM10010384_17740 [Streptomyces djakartensis]
MSTIDREVRKDLSIPHANPPGSGQQHLPSPKLRDLREQKFGYLKGSVLPFHEKGAKLWNVTEVWVIPKRALSNLGVREVFEWYGVAERVNSGRVLTQQQEVLHRQRAKNRYPSPGAAVADRFCVPQTAVQARPVFGVSAVQDIRRRDLEEICRLEQKIQLLPLLIGVVKVN